MSENKGKKGNQGGAQGGAKGKAPQEKKPESKVEQKPEKKVENNVPKTEEKKAPQQENKKPDPKEENKQQPAAANKGKDANKSQEKKEKQTGKGTVKAVLSGDTIVVISLAKNQQGPPKERVITISNINAPKLGRKKNDEKNATPDEPFAWHSKEFLRTRLIGRQVSYVIENKIPSGKEYGTVFVDNGKGKEENIAIAIVENGWATVRRPNVKEFWPELQLIIDLEDAAKQSNKGMHNPDTSNAVRPVVEANPTDIFAKLKGQPQTAIVEQVKDGNKLKLTLLPSFNEVTLLLSGVECPLNRPNDPEPFSREAKFFTEYHLLNREVNVVLEGADKNALYGTISYNNHYVAEELLGQGLGKYVDWSGQRTAFCDKLKAAENAAKEKKLRLWANYEAKQLNRQEEKKAAKPGKEITGKVVEVPNGGCVVISDANGNDHKIYLSSVKLPRQGAPVHPKGGKGGKDAKPQAPVKETKEEAFERAVAADAKEFLRKKLIGQRVRCVLDYNRPPPKQEEGDRNYCSVYLDKNNVAVDLVEAGFAKPAEHKGGEARSRDYEHIIFAETRAKKAGKGFYSSMDKAVVSHLVDVNDIKTVKAKLPGLQRAGRMRGVVEYVFSASRFKVQVPKENCVILLSLSGVQTPMRDDPEISNAAKAFSKERVHQRDIEFEVVGADKGTGFVGNIWLGKTSLSVMLLEEGYAKIFRNESRDPDMVIAEDTAKRQKKNMWKNYDEEKEKAKRVERQQQRDEQTKQSQEFIDVVVTEIVDGSTFYVQIVGKDAEALEELMKKLSEENSNDGYKPKKDELVKAQFTADDQWYRAKILKVDGDEFQVQYVDYGNVEYVPSARIRKLAKEFTDLAFQAQEAVLAFIKTPPIEDDTGKEAAEYLRDLVWGKTMIANVEYRENVPNGTRLHLTLGDRDSYVHVSAALLRAGLAKVERLKGKQYQDILAKLREEEDKAKSSHLGIWEYGDPGSDEDEEPTVEKKPVGKEKAPAAAAAKGGKKE